MYIFQFMCRINKNCINFAISVDTSKIDLFLLIKCEEKEIDSKIYEGSLYLLEDSLFKGE